MKHNQNGFAHAALLLIVLVLAVAGFALYKVVDSQSRTSSRQKDKDTSQAVDQSIDTVPTDAESANEETITKPEETTTASKPTTTSPDAQTQSPQKRTITFTKGGGSQQGDNVIVSANMSESQSGTCTFSFSLNGTERVKQTAMITNSNVCKKEIPVSSFPKSAIYSFTLTFLSSDGLVSATQSTYDIEVK